MKKYKYVVFILIWTIFPLSNSFSQISFMSYNIRYDNKNDKDNSWNNRKEDMVKLIKFYEAGIIGVQEALHDQLMFLDNELENCNYAGVGRVDGITKGEYSAVFYNKEKFELVKDSTFWLSPTPKKPSKGWDAALNRICTYALLKVKESGVKILVMNTHFDHQGKEARINSAKLITEKMNNINKEGYPVVLCGDFNVIPGSKVFSIISKEFKDGKRVSEKEFYGPQGTYNGFNQNAIAKKRIDYIFVKNIKVLSYFHIDDRRENNNYVSDHLPVFAKLKLPEK